jgi:hydrogenase maturation factor
MILLLELLCVSSGTSGAKDGDLLCLVKGVCIEGTSILARERGEELLIRGISPAFHLESKKFHLRMLSLSIQCMIRCL